MPFAEDFATCMAGGGITVDAGSIPDADTFTSVIAYVRQYQQGLDPDISAALDEATASENVASILADPDVGAIDASYMGLLQAFDAASGMPLSTCLDWCEYCLRQAADAAAAGGTAQEGSS
jgi:hypothetical protein